MEAIGNAGSAIGILSKDGVVLQESKLSAILMPTKNQCLLKQLVQSLCDTKQGYTQFGGLRPFGVSFLFAGWDKNYGFQLYMSDPSGNYSGWKAAAIGANNQAAQSMLKQDYKDEITREEAVQLALKVLSKTMDSTSLTSEKLELAEVFLHNGKVKYQVCSPDALSKLLLKSGVTQPAADAS
ncbi:UNVERIFIED_CONTAM: Proteasome subunit alpha type-4 [Sesamum radiatum]|uniref:Proteasome subunit alpha type-4 n=1 Tax=Sesamum radiatum TaxID=300843 RepID=A0AAW2T396_SESRA